MEYGRIVSAYIAQEIKNVLTAFNAQSKYISMIRVYQNDKTNWCVDAPKKFTFFYKAPSVIIKLENGRNIIEQCAVNGTKKALIELGKESRVKKNDD